MRPSPVHVPERFEHPVLQPAVRSSGEDAGLRLQMRASGLPGTREDEASAFSGAEGMSPGVSRVGGEVSGLGMLWIAYGVLRIVVAAVMIVYEPVATLMFGALLGRVANPYLLMSLFHAGYFFVIILSGLCGLFGILGGAAAVRGNRLLVIAAFLSLCDLPIGVTLGVYTLLTIFSDRKEPLQA